MAELKLTLTELERFTLKEMVALTRNIRRWGVRPWGFGVLVSMCSVIAWAITSDVIPLKSEVAIGNALLRLSIGMGMVAAGTVLIGLGLKFFSYGPKVRRAENRLNLLARSPAGCLALGIVGAFLKLREQFTEFLVLSNEGASPDWVLADLVKRYVRP